MHFVSVQRLRSELTGLRSEVESRETARGRPVAGGGLAPERREGGAGVEAGMVRRLSDLEREVEGLRGAFEYLRDRGKVPLGPDGVENLRRTFGNAAATDADRLRALGLLRRNRALTDEVANQAIGWLQSASDVRTKAELLEQMEGATNAVLKAPLMGLASRGEDAQVRRQAAENLRQFVDQPEVEDLLWHVVRGDADGKVREEAGEALAKGPLTETRAKALRERALNPETPLEERLIAVDALRHGNVAAPEVTAALAELAGNSRDPIERANLFRAFDGLDDPALKAPLVYGLQDPNPLVREEAADALSGFASDPQVEQWLRHVADSDADPRVRREALKSLEKLRP